MAEYVEPSAAELDRLEKSIHGSLQKLVSAPSVTYRGDVVKSMLTAGADIRDRVAFQLPLVNVAINAFQDLASTREWSVSGKERPVAETVDLINNYRTWDYTNGMVRLGLEPALRARSTDHNLVGRTAFRVDPVAKQIDYLDPTKLTYKQKRERMNGVVPPVAPNDVVWTYGYSTYEPTIPWGQVHLNHAIPVGMNGFIAPFMLAYPQAVTAWLLDQHVDTSVDGRKLRDILIVGKGLRAPILQAIEQVLQLWTGDPTKTGIPIVEVGQQYSGSAILQEQIAMLGLSKIPENFDRDAFNHYYANIIAGAFGLALRQFWQDDSNTNRALEEVQEARQQLKGPLAFVRAEQRLINNSQIVRLYAPASRPCHFEFLEESDTASLKDRAEALDKFANSLKSVGEATGARLKPEIIIRQAQEFGLLPGDMTIEEMLLSVEEVTALMQQEQAQTQNVTGDERIAQTPDNRTNAPNEVTIVKALLIRLQKEHEETQKAFELGEGEIVMNQYGKILDRRRPTYQKADILFKALDHNAISRYDDGNENETALNGSDDAVYIQGMLEVAGRE